MTHWFDRLAVGAAEGPRLTRRAGLQRAAVVILAAGPLGALATRASAAGIGAGPAQAGACDGCHATVAGSFSQAQRMCVSGSGRRDAGQRARRGRPRRRSPVSLFAQSACFSVAVSSSVAGKLACDASGPCQDGNPPGAPPPPQLQPPGVDLCAPCLQVGGKCCYGADPTAPCACIPPARECRDFCS